MNDYNGRGWAKPLPPSFIRAKLKRKEAQLLSTLHGIEALEKIGPRRAERLKRWRFKAELIQREIDQLRREV